MTARSRAADFFLLRTPALPLDRFVAWGDRLAGERDPLCAARMFLCDIMRQPEVYEALALASPSLWRRFGTLHDPSKVPAELAEKLGKYFARMAGRPTPFGLFAGVTLGKAGSQTRLELASSRVAKRRVSVDARLLRAILGKAAFQASTGSSHEVLANPTIYESGGSIRYLEKVEDDAGGGFRVVEVKPSDALTEALAISKHGVTVSELTRAVSSRTGVSLEEALDYVAQLREAQVLLPRQLSAYGRSPERSVLDLIREEDHRSTATRASGVAKLIDLVSAVDGTELAAGPLPLDDISRAARELHCDAGSDQPLNVCLMREPVRVTLSERDTRTLQRGVEALARIARPAATPLEDVRAAFYERFGYRAVSLMTVLDPDRGLGFPLSRGAARGPLPLLDDLPFARSGDDGTAWTHRDSALLSMVFDRTPTGRGEVSLSSADLDVLAAPNAVELPPSFTVIASIIRSDPRGNRVLIKSVRGTSGTSWLGRFCPHDPNLLAHVRAFARKEEAQRPEAIFAEVDYLPDGRAGNVVTRPDLGRPRIHAWGRGSLDGIQEIDLEDLFLTIDGGSLRLFSRSLDREIIPCLSNAHNFRDTVHPPTYRFLSLFRQHLDRSRSLTWDWGPLSGLPTLPRVSVNGCVLTRAQWTLSAQTVRLLTNAARSGDVGLAIQQLRDMFELPRLVLHVKGDRELPVDLSNPLSVLGWLSEARGSAPVRLVELLPDQDSLAASSPEGNFVHEIVLPFLSESDAVRPLSAGARARLSPKGIRTAIPGGEWFYVKVYAGSADLDRILLGPIRAMLDREAGHDPRGQWFFIRYSDPDRHLRVRFRVRDEAHYSALTAMVREWAPPLIEAGIVHRITIDTYEREIERYGGFEGMDAVERIFHVDSEAAVAALSSLPARDPDTARSLLVLAAIDSCLTSAELDPETRLGLMKRMESERRSEFNEVDWGAYEAGASKKFRAMRPLITTLISEAETRMDDPRMAPAIAFRAASVTLREAFRDLRELDARGALMKPYVDVIGPIVHMQTNRLFRAESRRQELVAYGLLRRAYASSLARS